MVELVDLPETTDKLIRQNARWYKGVLDDVRFLVRQWRAAPTAFNFAQLARHVGNKVVEWPIAALVYPVVGFLGWHLAYRFSDHPVLFYARHRVSVDLARPHDLGGRHRRPRT